MKDIEFLHFAPGNSCWHHHDPRLKLFEMTIWSLLSLLGKPMVLALSGLILFTAHGMAGSRLKRFRRPLLFWLLMSIVIVFTSGLKQDTPALVLGNWSTPLSIPGLSAGLLRSLRLLAVLAAGQLLTATTDTTHLAAAIRHISCFLPTQWSATLATAFSLTLAFIPWLMDEAALVRNAALSRGLGERRSLFRRALALGLPLTDATMRRADQTTDALLSRCYSSEPTPQNLKMTLADGILFAIVVFPPVTLQVFFMIKLPPG